MKWLFIILIFLSQAAYSQVGNKNLFFNASNEAPRPNEFNWDNLTPQSPTAYNNAGTVVVENKSFTNLNVGTNSGNDIYVSGNTNIIIRNCYLGPSIRKGISVEGLSAGFTVQIINCLFVSNEMAIEFTSSSGNIQIDNCQFVNPWGQALCKGQATQFSFISNTPNSYIRNCEMENFRGEGSTEDWISMFSTTGVPGNYIDVSNNKARGGGPSGSGGGFIAGDGDGRYIKIESNKFYNPGNYICAAAGGGDIILRNNLGYQAQNEVQNIAMYSYITNASTFCNNITIESNGMLLQNSNNYYCYCTPTCGDVTGIDESQAEPTNGWLQSNVIITLAQLNFPTTIIDFVDEDRLWHLRDESQQFSSFWNSGPCYSGDAQYPRPVSNAGSDQIIGGTTATVSGSGSTSTDGFNYQWVQVSGPATATISTPQAVSTNISGMSSAGVYEFRLVVTNNSGAADADWVEIQKL